MPVRMLRGKSHCHEITTKKRAPRKPGHPFIVFTIRAVPFLEFMTCAALIFLYVFLVTAGAGPGLRAVAVVAQVALRFHETCRFLGMAVCAYHGGRAFEIAVLGVFAMETFP